jgi:hypothetical protein
MNWSSLQSETSAVTSRGTLFCLPEARKCRGTPRLTARGDIFYRVLPSGSEGSSKPEVPQLTPWNDIKRGERSEGPHCQKHLKVNGEGIDDKSFGS